MARFFAKINASQGLVQKILWAISEEKELLAFRAQIIERRSALGVLVGLVNSGALEAVRARVEDVGSQVRVASESLSQQLATYQTQIVGVIAHVPHGISEQLFTVVSPNGVPIPISLAYCTSYQTLDQLLKTYLQGRSEAGILYVKRGDYNIVSPDGEVVPPPQFTGILKSNLRLEMCIVKSLHFGDGICPQCKYSRPATRSANGWSACQNPECGARFQILLGSALLPPQVKPPRDPGFELGDGPELFRRIRIMATKSMKEDLHFVALVVRVARLAAEVALWKEGAMRLRQILQKAGVQVEFEPLREEAKLQRLES
ncbi:hypothetical protein B0H16DRAFT_1565802 [Mycena metata]|uniref:Ubiquitin-like domain-containing protein n=1 Tax=Mycena metata TaxID=1033252 RepID=A0AAD7IGA8_9AGAR|nr:hypothetical protein B0H16DRAFT_1565802 [Mycena metata]